MMLNIPLNLIVISDWELFLFTLSYNFKTIEDCKSPVNKRSITGKYNKLELEEWVRV
jgi:hypothetical protein